MKKFITTFVVLFLISPVIAEETKFMKVTRDKNAIPLTLETSTATYKKGEVTVDLVGVIHIADTIYYQKLNNQLLQYDVLLYELVAPPGTIPEKKKVKGITVQQIVGMLLQVDFQMNVVNYKPKHFVHADLSFEGMKKAMADRGEDGVTLILGIARDLLINNNASKLKKTGVNQVDVNKFEHKDIAVWIKRVMAHSMDQQGADGGAFGQTIGNILIGDRNKACMKVLDKQLKAGKKKLGIFYGAAHMPDFERRLLKMGFKKQTQTWQCAWDIRPMGAEFLLRMMLK